MRFTNTSRQAAASLMTLIADPTAGSRSADSDATGTVVVVVGTKPKSA